MARVGVFAAEDATATSDEEAGQICTIGGESFAASTKVLLASGAAIPISKLKPGDKVLATDTKTGKTRAEAVTAVLVHHDTDLYDLTVKTARGTAVIHTTSSHLFWDPSLNQWIPAEQLKKGEALKTPDGALATADGGITPVDHDGWMWDLTVPGNNDHDFYVEPATVAPSTHDGRTAIALLVHNCGDGEQSSLFDEQPYRTTVFNGKTLGTLEIDGEEIPLTSRGADPANYIARGMLRGRPPLSCEREAS